MKYIERGLEKRLKASFSESPLVILEGARATGKSSLLEHARSSGWLSDIRSFADPIELAAATAAPREYINSLAKGTAIDEAQLAEEVTLAIKERIDRDPSPGQLILTGSTRLRRNALGGSDPFAGRVGSPPVLGPLTIGELLGKPHNLVELLFASDLTDLSVGPPIRRSDLLSLIQRPRLPGLVSLSDHEVQDRATNYVDSITRLEAFASLDVRNFGALARYLAGRTSTLVNVAEFSRDVGSARATVDGYLAHLEEALLIHRLKAWRISKDKSETDRAKLHFFDSGLAGAIGQLQPEQSPQDLGRLVETFVVGELATQAEWLDEVVTCYHWRFKNTDEVDLLLEDSSGRVVCIEVKSAEEVSLSDFKGIDAFKRKYPDRFHRGVILFAGSKVLPFGEDRWAIPFAALRVLPDEKPDDPAASVIARIAQRRAAASSKDREALERRDAIDRAIVDQLEQLGKSSGLTYGITTGGREFQLTRGLQLQDPRTPTVKTTLVNIMVDVLRDTASVHIALHSVKRSTKVVDTALGDGDASEVVASWLEQSADAIANWFIAFDKSQRRS